MVGLHSYAIGTAFWIGTQCAGLNGKHSVLRPVITAKCVCLVDPHVRILSAMYAKSLNLEIALLSFSDKAGRYINWSAGITPPPECCKRDVVSAVAAALSSATSNCAGNVLPLASARRMIPAHAFALKKYRCGIESCSSTCDNEHTAASLGQAEILGIQNPPCDCSPGSIHTTSVLPFPPWRLKFLGFAHQGAEEAAERVALVGEDAGDVFPDADCFRLASLGSNMVNCIEQLHVFDGEGAARIGQTFAHAGHAESLARGATDHQLRRLDRAGQYLAHELCHVAQVRHVRPPVG